MHLRQDLTVTLFISMHLLFGQSVARADSTTYNTRPVNTAGTPGTNERAPGANDTPLQFPPPLTPEQKAQQLADHLSQCASEIKDAESLAARNDWRAAAKALEAVIEENERNEVAHSELSVACYHLGDYSKALSEADWALRLNPKYAPAYIQLGTVKARLGDLSGSERAYLKADRTRSVLGKV